MKIGFFAAHGAGAPAGFPASLSGAGVYSAKGVASPAFSDATGGAPYHGTEGGGFPIGPKGLRALSKRHADNANSQP